MGDSNMRITLNLLLPFVGHNPLCLEQQTGAFGRAFLGASRCNCGLKKALDANMPATGWRVFIEKHGIHALWCKCPEFTRGLHEACTCGLGEACALLETALRENRYPSDDQWRRVIDKGKPNQ